MVGYTKRSRRPRTDHPNYTTPYQQHHYHYCLLLYFSYFYLPLSFVYILFIVIISAHSSTLVCLTFDAFYTYLFISLPLYFLPLYLSTFI